MNFSHTPTLPPAPLLYPSNIPPAPLLYPSNIASFPGLPHLQFLIACSILQAIKNWRRGRPGNEATYNILPSHLHLSYTPPTSHPSHMHLPQCHMHLSHTPPKFHPSHLHLSHTPPICIPPQILPHLSNKHSVPNRT